MISTGIALSQGNLGNRIRVRLSNGEIISAIAQTNIIGGQVSVVRDDRTKQYHCFSASSPVTQQQKTQKLFKSRPIEEELKNDLYILYTIIRFKETRTMPLGGVWDWYWLDYYLRLPSGKPKLLVSVPFSFFSDSSFLFTAGGFLNYGVLSFDKKGDWMVTIVNYWSEMIRYETNPPLPPEQQTGDYTRYEDFQHYLNLYFIKGNNVREVNLSTIQRQVGAYHPITYTSYPPLNVLAGFIERRITTTLDDSNFGVLVPIKQDYFINFPTNHYKQTNRTLKAISPTNNFGETYYVALANYDFAYSRVHQYALLNENNELTLSEPVALPDAIYHAEEVIESYPNGNSGIGQNNPATISDLQGSRSWNRSYLLPDKLEITETYIPSSAGYIATTKGWSIINVSDLSPVLINVDKTQCFYIDEVKDEVAEDFNLDVELSNSSIVQKHIKLFGEYKLLHFDGTTKRVVNRVPIELFEYISQFEGLSFIALSIDNIEAPFYTDRAISYHWDKNKIIFPFYKKGNDYKFNWAELFKTESAFKKKTVLIDFLECLVSIDSDSNTVRVLRNRTFKARTAPFVKGNETLVDHPEFNVNDESNRYGFRIMSIGLNSSKFP